MKDLEKLLMSKKEEGPSSERTLDAKKDVIKELLEMALEQMKSRFGEDMGNMKKVSIMADDKTGLKEGLDKAKEVVDGVPEEVMEEPKLNDSHCDPSKENIDPEEESILARRLRKQKMGL